MLICVYYILVTFHNIFYTIKSEKQKQKHEDYDKLLAQILLPSLHSYPIPLSEVLSMKDCVYFTTF